MEFSFYSPIDIFISLVLGFIMFGIGLSLTPQNFRNIALYPKAFVVGLSAQMIALPLIAFVIAEVSNLSLPVKIGLILLASCPGGTTSGFITYFFKGNVALSITLTAVNSLLTLFSIPFITNLALRHYYGSGTLIHLPFLDTVIQIFMVTILPATLGVIFKYVKPQTAEKIQKPLKFLLIIALAVVFVIKFFASEKNGGTGISAGEFLHILPYALALNVACMLTGYFIGIFSKLGKQNSYTISVEAAVHNTTLAFLIAGALLQNQEMVKPSLVYSLFSFWTALVWSLIVKKVNRTKPFGEFKLETSAEQVPGN
jgi:bile acid:Na+ symporter, BASS family